MRRLLALTLLALLAPAAAHASSSLIPTRSTTMLGLLTTEGWPIAPKFMGERVGWVDGEPGTVRVWTGDPATRRVRRIHTLTDSFGGSFMSRPRFAASATRIAVDAPMHQGGVGGAGAPGDLRGALDRGWLDLDGDHLLQIGDVAGQVRLFDPIGNERVDVTLPEPSERQEGFVFQGSPSKLAGDLIAYHQHRDGGVLEWRTRRVLLRTGTGEFGALVDLQRDGTTLWAAQPYGSAQRGPFTVLTLAGERIPLPLPADAVPILAGGRIAFHDHTRNAIVVTDLRGRELGATALTPDAGTSDLVPDHGGAPRAPRPVLSDFDGRRATWTYRPCAVPVVVVWDVDAGELEQPRPPCRAARLAGKVREQDDGHRVPLRCDAARLTGCATRLTLRTRRGRILHTMRVDLPAGTRRGVSVHGRATEARRLAVVTEPALRPALGERRTWRVVVR